MESVGGIQRYVAALVRALREHLGEQNVRVQAIQGRAVPGGRGGQGFTTRAKLRFAGQALRETKRWKPDLVICAHVGLAPLGWMLRLLFRCPYWVVAYGYEVWGVPPLLKRRALAQTDLLLAISDFTRQEVVKRCQLSLERTQLLPPALENLPHPEAAWRAAVPVLDGRRIVLTVGRLAAAERYKGHDVLLRAWPHVLEKIPGAVFLIVGDGDDRPRLEQLAAELGLGDSVCFAGTLHEHLLAACYEACDVFAMPARTVLDNGEPRGEGFGIVFLEAMARAKPVLGPDFGAPTEFIRHGEHGLLVDAEDSASVAQALIELLNSPERARQMGQAARQWVMREYSYERFCERIRQILSQPA